MVAKFGTPFPFCTNCTGSGTDNIYNGGRLKYQESWWQLGGGLLRPASSLVFGWRSGQASIEIGHKPYSFSSVLHPTQRNNHFTVAFSKLFERMAQVQKPVAAGEGRFLKGELKLSAKQELGWREEEVGCW